MKLEYKVVGQRSYQAKDGTARVVVIVLDLGLARLGIGRIVELVGELPNGETGEVEVEVLRVVGSSVLCRVRA